MFIDIAAYLCSILFVIFGLYYQRRYHKCLSELEALKNKFKNNPNYETQQFMADMLRGDVLFHIERVPPESVFIRRD